MRQPSLLLTRKNFNQTRRWPRSKVVAVLDAVRIAGRWVSQIVLDRLTALSMREDAPVRSKVVEMFCRQTGWVNRRGEPCSSSANVALNRLEAQGRVRLPPAQVRGASGHSRKLVDDGQELPVLPVLPQSVQQIKQLEFQLLSGAKDPDHGLWNRLIIREHPLKAAPLVGSVGDDRHPGRGLWLHTLQAYRTDRIPLGCAWAKLWARSPQSDAVHRNEQPAADKESARWLEAYQVALGLARRMPQTHLVVCGDRESDIFELYDQGEVAPKNLHLLVRAQHDRLLESGRKLWAELSRQPVGGSMRVQVPRNKTHPARIATLELKWAAVEATPPQVALKKSWSSIPLHAVFAREVDPPAGIQPIEWMLITDWPVLSLKMARRLVCWYGLRWGIECWHQVLKDVCGVETRQMKTAQALERALALDIMVAWRAQMLCRLGKESPSLPAHSHYSQAELAVLEVLKKKTAAALTSPPVDLINPPSAAPPTQSTLSLAQANLLVAMLGGFWGRKGDGHPGAKSLSRGLELLAVIVDYCQITQLPPKRPRHPPKRPRKPG